MKQLTKAGRPKNRQAWYELAIANDLHVDNGDTIYYVNTGKSKSHSDIKKVTHYYYKDFDGNEIAPFDELNIVSVNHFQKDLKNVKEGKNSTVKSRKEVIESRIR